RETGATIKGATTEDITLTPGEQVFTIKRGDLEFETDMFVLKKGDVVTLRIDLLPDKLQATLGDKPLGSKALRNQPAGNSIAGESAKGWHGWPADAPPPAIAPFDAAQARQHQEAWAAHLGVPVEFENSIGMKFVLIPPGEFTMGSTATEIEAALVAAGGDANWKEHISSEGPRHKVILTQPLYLGVHEVTQPQYEKVMGQNPSHFAPMGAGKDAVVGLDTSSSAVETVSWNDAAEFCAKLSEQEKLKPFYFRSGETVTMLEGTGYRLPTEAEWEFACRAGTTTRYWIGDKDEALPAAGWFGVNSGGRTHAVGELKANPLGLYDIHGNVWEWVQDWWEPTYYGQFREKPALDPDGPSSAGSRRVIRGGSWTYNASNCRASDRYAHGPSLRSLNIGFRLALAVDAVKAAIAKGQASPADAVSGWHGWPADAPRPAIASFDDKQAKQHQEAWAAHLGVPVEFENSIGMQFVLIPPGEFTMGSTAAEIEAALVVAGEDKHWQDCIKSEAPQHKVILTQPLYLSVHEVTQTQYEQVVGQNPSHFSVNGPGKEAVVGLDTSAYPVEMVSWNDSTEFCAKLSEQEKLKPFYFRSGETVTMLSGTGYRLPTEAEWEFSCRAGTTTKYWIGDNDDSLPAAGWFGVNSGGREHAVGELKANPLGLYDIHGNVYEWVQDWWEPTYYSQFQEKPALNQGGPSSAGSRRVIRGGSWYYLASYCRASHRYAADPASRNSGIGFRPALAVDAVKAAIAKEQDSPADAVSGWHGWPADAPRPAIAPFDALQARKHQEEWAAHLGLPVEYTNSIGMKFVLIPPGAFKMGEGDGAVSVTLTRPFRLGVHEVTQGQWQAVMGTEPWKAFRDHQPATQNAAAHITWVEANEFCRKVTETERQAGKIPEDWEYRLPTEAEWEYAARAGTTTRYSFGDDSSQLSEYSWWRDNADAKGEKYAHEVGMFKPNPWGLFDIHGNVYEWCLDAMLGQLPGGFDPLVEPPGLENRVNRGGGWDHRDEFAHTSSNRRGTLQNDRRNNLGLRMVLAQMGETATE
ncbi:MAG: formylglycine-generating enzyme family protein, partial [Pirellulales bacterium]